MNPRTARHKDNKVTVNAAYGLYGSTGWSLDIQKGNKEPTNRGKMCKQYKI